MSERNRFGFHVSLRAENLQGSLNPFCKITLLNASGSSAKLLHRTAADYQTENPRWGDNLKMQVSFGETNRLKFEVFDNENAAAKVIGKAEIACASLVRFEEQEIPLSPSGSLFITSRISVDDNSTFYLKLSAAHLKGMDLGGTNDPFYILSVLEEGSRRELYRSEVLDDCENPRWRPQSIAIGELRDGAIDKELLIEVFDDDNFGKDFIGHKWTSLTELNHRGQLLELTSTRGDTTGLITVEAAKITNSTEFIQHIRSGVQISLLFGIDLGRSTSQFHLEKEESNPYISALRSIGSALEGYDSDRRLSVLGFGVHPAGAQHDSGIWDLGPGEVTGVNGVVEAYKAAIANNPVFGESKQLYELLVRVRNQLQIAAQGSSYFMLVLLTDGRMNDLRRCKEVMVELSHMPLSVVIVGIGPGNFKDMSALDSDAELISTDKGAIAERDIVQFGNFSRATDLRTFVMDVVSEVPQQMSDYFIARGS